MKANPSPRPAASGWMQRTLDWLKQTPPTSVSVYLSRILLVGWTAPCLMTFAACDVLPRVAPPPTSTCHVPATSLQPTREPPMQDVTNEQLSKSEQAVREALRTCNADKVDALQYLNDQNVKPAAK